MITHKLEIGFGVGQDKDGRTICLRERNKALQAIKEYATRHFGGCTLVETEGTWRDPATFQLFDEPGRTLIVYVDAAQSLDAIRGMANVVKAEMFQAAVFVVLTKLQRCELV